MAIRRFVVTAVTDASGDAEVYSPHLSGALISFRYVKTDFDAGVDFVVTAEGTGQTLWSEEDVDASATRYPRAGLHDTAGVASLYAALGEAVNGKIVLAADRVKVVVSSGGDTKTGVFHITVDG